LIGINAKIQADATTLNDVTILAETAILPDTTKFGATILGEAR